MRPGQDLVTAGYAGLKGTSIIVRQKRQELEERFASRYLDSILDDAQRIEEAIKESSEKGLFLEYWEPAAAGGILTAIWNLSGSCRVGVEFSLSRIPVLQGTIEVCEIFGLNPYRLYSGHCWVGAVDNGGQVVEQLREKRIPAAVIGRVTKGIARLVVNDKETGYLNRPQPDELERVVPGDSLDWLNDLYGNKGLEQNKEAAGYERKDFGCY